jgi:high affinity sulfate transporter 1
MQLNRETLRQHLNRYVPITAWLPTYPRDLLRNDIVSGVTVWGVMVPVAMAYAQMAGLPPQYGLYAAFAAMLGYAVFGTSRQLKVTTSSTMAVMSAAVVAIMAGGDAARYAALSAALALTVGVILLLAGIVRLGFISDFLSKSVVTGFVFGLALVIAIGQLPKLLGLPSGEGDFFEQAYQLLTNLSEIKPYTVIVGVSALAVIFLVKRFFPRLPSGLVALVLGILAVSIFNLDAYGVSIVGEIPTGLPSLGIPQISLTDIPNLAAGALGIVFLAVGESLGGARSFAAKHRYEINPDQELIALGAANISAGLFQGFTVDASLSSSATADEAGARTQLSSIVTVVLIIVTLLVLAPLFHNLPNAVLAAIVIASVIGLMDVAEMKRFYTSNRIDFVLAGVALFGVLTTDVLTGLIIAVFLSLLIILYRASRPYVAVLGKVPGQVATYGDVARHPENVQVPGLLIVRLDAPLYFLNANVARGQILDLARGGDSPPKAILFDLGASADLDIASLDMVKNLVRELDEASIDVLLAQVRGKVRDRLRKAGVMADIGEDRIYLSVAAAVCDYEQPNPVGGSLWNKEQLQPALD